MAEEKRERERERERERDMSSERRHTYIQAHTLIKIFGGGGGATFYKQRCVAVYKLYSL